MHKGKLTNVNPPRITTEPKIRIIDEPLCGYEGILIEIKGKKKFGVSISCVNLTAVVDLNTSKMEKCDISNNFREVIIFK